MSRQRYPDAAALVKDRRWKAGLGMSAFDSAANYGGEDRSEWVVGLSKTRDSDALERCNFDVLLDSLGGESEVVEVARFGHWACGWVEQIHVRADATDKLEVLRESLNALADYPVLDDSAFSEEERAEQDETFDNSWVGWACDLARFMGLDADADDLCKRFGRRKLQAVLSVIYDEDVAYCGLEGAWVSEASIGRALGCYEMRDLAKRGNRLAARLVALAPPKSKRA